MRADTAGLSTYIWFCWSQTVSESASRWLIVKQTKATGCVAMKWEEEDEDDEDEGLREQIIKDSANSGV